MTTSLLAEISAVHRGLTSLRERLAGEEGTHEIVERIVALSQALGSKYDIKSYTNRGKKRHNAGEAGTIKATTTRLKKQLLYQRAARRKAEACISDLDSTLGHRLANIWLLRAGLAPANTPPQKLQEIFSDFGIKETAHIGRTSISSARDAFCEVAKGFNRGEIVRASYSYAAGKCGASSLPLYLVHIHDEAVLRLRSFLASGTAGSARLGRSTHSKILNHVLQLHTDSSSTSVMTELQPLARKDANTMACALLVPVKECVSKCMEGVAFCETGASVRVLHLITGDGIATNDLAARFVMYAMDAIAFEAGFAYFMIVWICASHLSNLNVMLAVCGGHVKDAARNDPICCNCSRLYRHLMPDYAEEFGAALWAYLDEAVRLRSPGECDPTARLRSENLFQLYGEAVLPREIVLLYNCGLDQPDHCDAQSAGRADVCRAFFTCLRRHCLRVDEKPIVSRFWTFAACVHGLLRFRLLNLPESVFSIGSVKPRAENHKRLNSFLAFYRNPEADQKLRIACLALHFTSHATSITAQKSGGGESGADREPTLVRLGRAEVQRKTSADLVALVPCLCMDGDLNIGRALFALMTTQSCIIIRFSCFLEYPTRLWEITVKFNPSGHIVCINTFLDCLEEELDCGYSTRLRSEALGKGSHADACAHLLSESIQNEVCHMLIHGSCTSLDVERKHQLAKRSAEGVKVKSVATGSRNLLLEEFRRQRSGHIQKQLDIEKRLPKLKSTHIRALAIQERPDLIQRPRGQLHWEKDVSMQARQSLVQEGNEEALQAYIAEHQQRFEKKVAEMKSFANKLLSQEASTLLTNQQLLAWMDENHDYFHGLRKTATASRRAHSRRAVASSEDMPTTKELVQVFPKLQAKTKEHLNGHVAGKLVHAGPGFFYFEAVGLTCFVSSARGQVWASEVEHVSDMRVVFDFSVPMFETLRPMQELLDERGCDPTEERPVEKLSLQFEALHHSLATWRVLECSTVQMPPKKEKKTKQADDAESCSSRSSSDFGFDSDAESLASHVESEAEAAMEEVSDSEKDAQDEQGADLAVSSLTRAPYGSKTVFNNGYLRCPTTGAMGLHLCACTESFAPLRSWVLQILQEDS